MNAADILKRVQRQFGDESNVQINEDDVLRWINDGMQDICVSNNLLETKATTITQAGQATYDLPTNMLTLRSVKFNGTKLRGLSTQEADELIPNYDDVAKYPVANPSHFWVWAEKVNVYPAPDSAGTLIAYFTREPTPVASLYDVPELPIKYHSRLVEFCLTQAYELDENWQAAQAKQSQFVSGINEMKESESWADREFYPTITVLPED